PVIKTSNTCRPSVRCCLSPALTQDSLTSGQSPTALPANAGKSTMARAKQQFCYDYPRPAVTVDAVIVTREERPRVLLIRRQHEPFAGMWALPGGFVDMDETLEASARRELEEESGVRVEALEQLHTFGDPGRDPRGRTVSVVYLGRVDAN